MYHDFANWYDKMMNSVDYDEWASYLDAFLKKHDCRSILECGCGTGNITLRLARKGYNIIASDLSEDMLMQTRKKMQKAGFHFPVIQQDMCSVSLHKPVDAIISACDGVNYLAASPKLFFLSAYAALKPGGILLFDISSKNKLSVALNNTSFSETGEDWAYICDCEYSDQDSVLNMFLTCFVKENSLYRRFEEQHIQQAYSNDEIVLMLEQANFKTVHCYKCFSTLEPDETDDRIQFLAVKPCE